MNSKNFLNILNCISTIVFVMILVFMCGYAGAGLFVCAFMVYKVLYIMLIGGLRTSLAHATANRRSKGMHEGAAKYFSVTLRYGAVCGVIICLIIFLLANSVSWLVYADVSCGAVLKYLGLYFLLRSICEVMCGYHIGNNNGSVVFIAEIANDLLLCILGPVMINSLKGYGEKVSELLKSPMMVNSYKAQGAAIAMCISSFIMLIILIAGARGNIGRLRNSRNDVRGDVRFNTTAYILGSCFESIKVMSFPYVLYFIYILVYVRILTNENTGLMDVYSSVGCFAAIIFTIIQLQESLIGEYISAYRNKLRSDYKKDEIKNYTSSLNMLLKNSLLLVMPFACSCMCYSKGIASVVFVNSDEIAYKLVIIAGICLIFAGLDKVTKAILASSGYSKLIFVGNIVGFLSSVLYCLIAAGADADGIKIGTGLIIYFALCFIAHMIPVIRNMTIRYNDLLARMAVCGIASILLVILDMILARFLNMNLLILVLCVLCGYIIYIISLMALHGVNSRDIKSLRGTVIYYPLNFIGGLLGIR